MNNMRKVHQMYSLVVKTQRLTRIIESCSFWPCWSTYLHPLFWNARDFFVLHLQVQISAETSLDVQRRRKVSDVLLFCVDEVAANTRYEERIYSQVPDL